MMRTIQKKTTDILQIMRKYPVVSAAFLFSLYILLFTFAEKIDPVSVTLIDTGLDHLIPFSKYAVFFYCTWHLEILTILLSLLYCRDLKTYWELTVKLTSGLILILFICMLFPNMVDLRPAVVEGKDVFARLTRVVYSLDNARNVFPSGHAFGAVLMALSWGKIGTRSWQKAIAWILNAGIILSTLLLKQHSVIDAAGGILLAVLVEKSADWILNRMGEARSARKRKVFVGAKLS